MDGQGKVSKQVMLSVLNLTNIAFIHFNVKDKSDEMSKGELYDTI